MDSHVLVVVRPETVLPTPPRRLRRVLTSPCTWLVAVALTVYEIFAYHQYTQLQDAAMDLGIFYQTVAGWAFHGNPYVPIKGFSQLGDHFSPVFALLAPLLWLHNSPVMLVFAQPVLLCASAVPVYLAVRRMWNTWFATALTAAYLFSSGMQHSIAFPVHEVMFSAVLIAWALERALAGRWTAASVLMGLTCLVKEDMDLMIVAFGVYALLNRRWRQGAALIVGGLAAYELTIHVLIPAFGPGYTYTGAYATTLHATTSYGMLAALLFHPRHTAHLLFAGRVKSALWRHLLEPVGFACVASPIALLALPNLVSRLVSSNNNQWSWDYHYDMPLMPVLFLAAADGLARLVRLARRLPFRVPRRLDLIAAGVLATVALSVTAFQSVRELPLGQWLRTSAYDAEPGWLADVRNAVAVVPAGVDVQVSDSVGTAFVARDTVTLTDDNYGRGDWAVVDTAHPFPDAAHVDAYLATIRREGFRETARFGPVLVLHRG